MFFGLTLSRIGRRTSGIDLTRKMHARHPVLPRTSRKSVTLAPFEGEHSNTARIIAAPVQSSVLLLNVFCPPLVLNTCSVLISTLVAPTPPVPDNVEILSKGHP